MRDRAKTSGLRVSWRLLWSTVAEAIPYIGLTFLILTTLVFVQQIGRYSQVILSFQASSEATLTFLLSLLPGIVVITLPVALVLGTVITCSRQSTDNELTVAQACGIDQRVLGLPFLALGLAGTLLSIYLTTDVAPRSLRQLKALRSRILLQEATLQIKPHLFITTFPNILLYVQDVDARTGDWLGVFILQQDENKRQTRLLTAERGRLRITSAPRFSLEAELIRGVSYETSEAGLTTSLRPDPNARPEAISEGAISEIETASDFQKASIKLTDRGANGDELLESAGTISEMTLPQLDRMSRRGATAKDRLKARVEWHKRLAFPFACLTLTYITFLVALRGRRFSTRPRTVVAILFVALAYYLVLVAGQNLASAGTLPVWLGVWLSNILLVAYILLASLASGRRSRLAQSAPVRYVIDHHLRPILARWSRSPQKPGPGRLATPQTADPSGPASPPDFAAAPSEARGLRFSLINLINYLIISEIAKYFLLALLALVITSITFTLFDLIPAISKSDATAGYAVSYLAYLAPQLAYYVAPFAIMVAILAGCSVLARSNQFVVLSSVGQGKSRIALAVLATTIFLGFGLWFLSEQLLPITNREQDLRYHRIKNKQLEQTTIAFGRKWVFGRNRTFYSYQRIEADNTLRNATVYQLSADRQLLERSYIFGSARQVDSNRWRLVDGRTEVIKPDLTIERRNASETPLTLDIEDGAGIFRRTVNESTKMSTGELQDYIEQLHGVGIASTEMELDLQKRIAFPFSCLTLGILAIPFATTRRARRSSPILSVAIGVGISLILWLLMTVFEAAGKQESLPVTVAIWGPQVLFLAIGVFLNARESRM
jgi:LPS export ABC transporter permease LptG